MFSSNKDTSINKVLNPFKITKDSAIEFTIGELRGTGLWRFKKIIEFTVGDRIYSRYLIHSDLSEDEMIIEVFPATTKTETYLYRLSDSVPFSEDFLEVAGQLYLTTPDGTEYRRCIMPNNEDRLDGLKGRIKVLEVSSNEIERYGEITLWDYEREDSGISKFLNVEMTEEDGLFRIFEGEMLDDIFYKVYAAN